MQRGAAESVVRWHGAMYRRTKNSRHCWFAYADCHAHGLAIPEWVLAYLDGPARQFTAWARKDGRPPRPAAPAIAEALAMKRRGRDSGRGGAGDVFSAFHLAIRDSALAQHAWAYVVSGHKTSLAPERVADARGNTVSPETVTGPRCVVAPHRSVSKSSRNPLRGICVHSGRLLSA
jgi:hypothetical protein